VRGYGSRAGHVAIRNRGTLGGSLAYADPAAELPACAVALSATLVLGSLAGERQVKAEDFFKGLFETALEPGELIVAVKFPAMQAGTSCRPPTRPQMHRP
jgi:aerobic carbon-monoxide dehydrogenase medium subunit